MDNEAFRALVEERAKPKSTKEIAREAVEEEFRTRKQKRKRGGAGGSSSEESDDSDREDVPSKQEVLIPAVAKKKARAEHESKYRDRAKERREGKNIDYQGQAALLEGVTAADADEGEMDQVAISKYLGGDEEHTHLVKGLDVALARRVRREMDKGTTETESAALPSTTRQEQMSTVVVRDATEARLLLQNIKPQSELGRQMLSHLKQVHLLSKDVSKVTVRTSPAGLAIQRSTITFSTHGNPHDRNRAWELPLESLQAFATNKDLDASSNAETVKGATLLDSTLLYQIKCAFEHHTTNRHDKSIDGTEQNFTCSAEKGRDEDDDEEDIFDDADGQYMPPAKTESNVPESIALKAKDKSIFDGLTAPKVSHSTPATTSSHLMTEKRQKVISRDVLGLSTMVPKSKPPNMGISIASYEGGYGEEMDVDFDGRFAAEDEDSVGKKGKKKVSPKEQQGRS
jgi:hypothetical protein